MMFVARQSKFRGKTGVRNFAGFWVLCCLPQCPKNAPPLEQISASRPRLARRMPKSSLSWAKTLEPEKSYWVREKLLVSCFPTPVLMNIVSERRALDYLQPYYEKRRPILKTIKDFWPRAFQNMSGTSLHLQHQQDQEALSFLEDVWLVRDKEEPRCFTLEFVCRIYLFLLSKIVGLTKSL